MDAATIEHEALALSAAERDLLADRLLQTLDVENSARLQRWVGEAELRLQSFERGETEEVDGAVAVASIRRRLK